MKLNPNDKIKYKSDIGLKQLRNNVMIILSYVFILWFWQFTLSYQSSMYTLMNIGVFFMFMFGAIGCIVSREDSGAIVKSTKSQIITYLAITFVYEMFLRSVIYEMPSSMTDPSIGVAKNFLTVVSTMLKIGLPIAYITWMLQKFAVYKKGISKERQMKILRDVRETFSKSNEEKAQSKKNNFNDRY